MRSETPMLDMLHGASGRVRLHMPGHKGRLPAEWVNSALDTTEIGPTDDLFLPCGGIAVSYTHLDVYKRQSTW